ncbi:MAG: tRNA epoxyqueuosine(34) reductase QueG [Polyangiaceae bacterium]
MTLREIVRERARLLGLEHVGFARADAPLEADHARYQRFVDRGMHGVMDWLARDADARRTLDGPAILPGARSVISVARPYARSPSAEARDPDVARLIARYARGQDYHNHFRKKLRLLAKFVRTLGEGVEARPLCDVEPLLERAWAARAGLGFVGKNGLVIVPGRGSFVLLGEVVTTLDLGADAPMAERYGSCTRCLDACPTSAFDAPFVLDPRRCVAYLTIEAAPETPADRGDLGEHLFGCDECQVVCPFNRTEAPSPDATRPFAPHARWAELDLGDLACLTDAEFERISEGSPIGRATRRGLARSAIRVARTRLSTGEDPARRDAARAALVKACAAADREIAEFAQAALDTDGPSRARLG